MTVESDRSGPGPDHAGECPGEGGLPRTVGAEDGQHLAVGDLEADPREGRGAAVGDLEIRDRQHQLASGGPSGGPSDGPGGFPSGGAGEVGVGRTPRRNAAWTRVSAATSSGSPVPTTAPLSST